ncbi:MAG: hypothetical protein GVY06_03060 [Alphaproteobacteria bacterium]|jgi:gamma-glutamylcyclotransferase (GGCT)/AIG2-like uncharacterized protein YtfP|nr:hypothetical protein [Alphaproteobacteria bacterium]
MPPPVSPGDLFAFYGLLKKGAAGMPAHIDLEAAGRFEGPCRFRAAMHDLGGFPGIVEGETLCHAVRWRISDTAIVPALDAFEDVSDDPSTSLYLRRRTELLDDLGRQTGEQAFVYWFNRPSGAYPFIADGNWPLEAGRTFA